MGSRGETSGVGRVYVAIVLASDIGECNPVPVGWNAEWWNTSEVQDEGDDSGVGIVKLLLDIEWWGGGCGEGDESNNGGVAVE